MLARRPPAREPERRDAAAVAVGRAAARDRDAPGARRRDAGASSGSCSRSRWCWRPVPARWVWRLRLGQPGAAAHRRAGRRTRRRSTSRLELRLIAVQVLGVSARPVCFRADPGHSRTSAAAVHRRPASRRRTQPPAARSRRWSRAGRAVAGAAGRGRAVPADAREPVGAGSRLRPEQRADVLGRCPAGGQERTRCPGHLPPRCSTSYARFLARSR